MVTDTSHSAIITSHDFEPEVGAEWGLCKHDVFGRPCNLSRASHKTGPIYAYPKTSKPARKES